jgi:DNA-binding transcriptional LysR family regulator
MSRNVEIRHLRAYVAVAEELHFTRAAERLHVVQQTLSEQIRQLEAEVGVELIHRTTRKVELTPAGEVFLDHARNILQSLESAIVETTRTASGEDGHLRISYTPTLRAETLPMLVEAIHARAPGIRLTTCEAWPHEGVHGVSSGLFDATLARIPELAAGLDSHLIRNEPLGIVLAGSHPAARESTVSVDALAGDVIAIWPRQISPGYYQMVEELFCDNFAHGRVYEFENFAREGFLSDTLARVEIAAGRAFQVAFKTQYDPMPEAFVWRPISPAPVVGVQLVVREGPLSPALHNLIQIANEVSEENGWMTDPALAH